MLFGASEFLVEFFQKSGEQFGFVVNAHLVELLNPQINLGVFAVGVRIGPA